jgi:ribosomal-protein-alanine N-acetyltransferase
MTRRLTLPIRTGRLLLRDFVAADFDAIHAYSSDPEVTRFMFFGPRDEAASQDYLHEMLESQAQEPRLVWELAIVRRSDNRLIGACDLTLEDEREGDLGYILARHAWGQGYGTEAARAMVDAGFRQLGLERVFATCDVDNAASAHVLEKVGLRHEALLKNHKQAKGRWWDSYLYGIVRSDWQQTARTDKRASSQE